MTTKDGKYYLEKLMLIRTLCEALIGYWDEAESTLELFSTPYVTPEAIDGMIQIFEDVYKETQDVWIKEKISKALDQLKEILEKERLEREKEAEEAMQMIQKELV